MAGHAAAVIASASPELDWGWVPFVSALLLLFKAFEHEVVPDYDAARFRKVIGAVVLAVALPGLGSRALALVGLLDRTPAWGAYLGVTNLVLALYIGGFRLFVLPDRAQRERERLEEVARERQREEARQRADDEAQEALLAQINRRNRAIAILIALGALGSRVPDKGGGQDAESGQPGGGNGDGGDS